MLRFAEELLVLIEDGGGSGDAISVPDRTLRYAMAGAALLDLALEFRIDTDTQSLYLTDATPVGDDLLDPVLAEIVKEPDTRSCEYWVRRIARGGDEIRDLALGRLVEQGILETDDGHGFFALTRRVTHLHRYPPDWVERDIYTRIEGILFTDELPSSRDAVIISLAQSCGLFRRMLTVEEYAEVRERIELIAGLELVGQSVARSIRDLTLAETQAERRTVQQQGGGWPRASGSLPVIGHTLKMMGDIGAYFTEQYLKHGPVFEVNAPGNSFVVMAGQEANLFVVREGKSHLRSREVWEGFKDEMGAATLLPGMDGADHRLLRRTKRNGYSRDFFLERAPEAVAVVERELAALPVDRPLSVIQLMQRVMTEQISRLSAGASSRERIDDIIAFNRVMLMVFIARRIGKRYPRFMLRTPRLKRVRRRLELFIERVLDEHELSEDSGEAGDLIDDLLELHRTAPDFLANTDMFIAAMGPFIVGLDTVASTTAFALYALLEHPDLLERARAEADEMFAAGAPAAESVPQMTITRGVVLETLRMYPIVPLLPRTVSNSFELAGHRIPHGTNVLLAATVTHRLPEFFPDPGRFDIDRYSPERRENVQPGAFVPFGLGHHSCLGQGFAEVQMMLTVATLLHRAEIAPARSGYRLKVKHAPGPRPAGNFKIRVRPRR